MEGYLQSLGTPGAAIFTVAGFLATAYLLGRFVLSKSIGWQLVPQEQFFICLTVGIDLLILIATPLLWLGMLPNLALHVVFAGGLALGALLLVKERRSMVKLFSPLPWHMTPFVLLGLILLKNALSYPFSFDDLTYQIAVPDRWMKTNSLEVFPDNPFSAFPGVNLIGNLLLLKSGGLLTPLLFNYALGLIVGLAVHFLIRRHAGPWPATIMSLSLVLSLSYLMVFSSAYAEPWILLQLTGILFLIGTHQPEAQARANTLVNASLALRVGIEETMLLGLFAGFAASVKLTGMIVPVAVASFLIWMTAGETIKTKAVHVLAFVVPVLLIVLLFYSRAYLATGNPIYPYYGEYFTSDEAALKTSVYHHDAGKIKFGPALNSFGKIGWYYFVTPLLLSLGPVLSHDKDNGPFRVYDGYFGLQGLIYLLLIGGFLWAWFRGRRPDSDVRPTFVAYFGFGLLFYTFWFFTAQQARFLLPAFLCLVLAGSCAWHLLPRKLGVTVLILIVILSLGSLLPGPMPVHLWLSMQTAVDQRATPTKLLEAAVQDKYVDACGRMRDLPASAKVLLLYEQRGLYVPRNYVIGTPYFQESLFTPPDKTATAADLLVALRREGITHVMVGLGNKDPDRMDKYMSLGRPFQLKVLELIRLGDSEKKEDAARGRLRVLAKFAGLPASPDRPPPIEFVLCVIEYGTDLPK